MDRQYWRVIAPGRKEVTGCIGELVEALLSSGAANLVPLLARPLNAHRFENVEVIPGENVEDEKERGCTRRTQTRSLSQSHLTETNRIEQHHAILKVNPGIDNNLKSFPCLPSEIHHAIFNNIDDVQDVLCLSLTSRYFWAVGLSHIEDHIVSSLAPWAGERIICVSERSDPRDFPPGLLSPAEQEDLIELNHVHDLNNFSIKHKWKKTGGPSLSQRLQEWFKEYEAKHPMSNADRIEISTGLKPEILEFYPRNQPWVLRNLTTKEYVRGEALALKDLFIHGPHIDVIGFSEVLLSRISWSSQPVEVGHGKNMAHGKWAGHRFEITPLATLKKESDSAQWVDVSDELFRELDVIVTSQRGDDWRDHLSRRNQEVPAPVALGYS
ncbi:uncharacterized protein N7483_009190 [Penicillium malachiteum]|uniref:uncharacterized protein n=1 Tax=Penicillium malachiteum TaxID=1324776 RepID=UPI0025495CDA|nr:uncharacterized protein N7483_009190 [Penicillium malachiteum]KAJ5721256.1 hypothetical protein N7483_009190 [Penicillium malachiteum]